MKQLAFQKKVGFLALLIFVALSVSATAGTAMKGILGDWQITTDFDGRQFQSILSFSTDKAGKLTGQWISFGVSELTDIKYEGSQLSFTQVSQFGDREFRRTFTGTIEGGKLSGTVSSDRGRSEVEGKRLRRMSPAAGNWQLTFNVGDRQVNPTLVIKANDNNKLSAVCQSQRGQQEISDVTFKAGKLTFKRTSEFQGRQRESSFEGTIKGNKLTGTMKSERGEIEVEGQREGGDRESGGKSGEGTGTPA